MSNDWRTVLRQRICGDCLFDEPLAPLTTWKVGGATQCLVRPRHEEDLKVLSAVIQDAGVPWWVLGGGSNVLISDQGLPGVVVQLSHLSQIETQPEQRLSVGGGCSLAELVRTTVEQGLGGIEALAGIPGSVGGAVSGNAGAAGQQIGQRVVDARVWTPLEHHDVTTWSAEQCDFGYRHSALIPDHVVINVTLQLDHCSVEALRARSSEVLAHRRQAHNVGGPNAGSVFRNPPGQQAWRLIGDCGMRGVQVGKAQVSSQHANFIVNTGGATAEEIYQLIHKVQHAVARHHGVSLQPEVRLLGSFGEVDEE
ncbi:UDP-N-acetylmuramate dehydrogenase [Desulfuromonas acetoxidans]|uniref:UDP-N-acetylenolpyruvoylglucosamine reductase n=1 Tax=Desulfuromonas acetoxidans (strain DSM 684 / 11070) TaxID=281689 RepID=Q1JXB7_DESA6|nr:UDP-N-acetylmuramate dehydrogenase [Desulfuromonas acetoxidans]EAT14875.1 UDP-N-acetylenolpyruvoylglucosamine reductase [Desulfuromonas acetoxidans DSM 684]MBF0646843.1 UDP-N-acetylmuramate dehydrogenase [Desulfuromonas acetoxidans]NVD23335.1 UDP-N-acetylmuramate dehydrogenase [Desulfuromonas acetoxidans]NVE15424.1 UDP-N-acetylmuramate dehydrogenase [Desulfuromonas acetoxidans]